MTTFEKIEASIRSEAEDMQGNGDLVDSYWVLWCKVTGIEEMTEQELQDEFEDLLESKEDE